MAISQTLNAVSLGGLHAFGKEMGNGIFTVVYEIGAECYHIIHAVSQRLGHFEKQLVGIAH